MPANVSLLDFRAGWEFRGNLNDELGVNPFVVHGTGVTFPPGGGVHLDGSTGWLEVDNSTFGALRDGEGLAILIDFAFDDVTAAQFVFGRQSEWQLQADAGGHAYLETFPLAGGSKFSAVKNFASGARHTLYADYDRANLHAQLDGGSLTAGDAATGDVKVILGEANPARLMIGRLNHDEGGGLVPFVGTIYRLYFWTRYGAALTAAEIEAMRTAPGPLWLPGRREGLAPIARRTYLNLYRAAPAADLEAICQIVRVGAGPERLEVDGAAAFDQQTGTHAYLSPDDGVTLGDPFAWPETAQDYPGVGGGYYAMSGTVYNAVAGHPVQVWQRQFQHSGDMIYSNHLVVRWSLDGGRTWNAGVELAYDVGTLPFDPSDPANAGYYGKSEAGPGPYTGHSLLVGADGKLLVPAGNVNTTEPGNAAALWKRGAKLCRLTWTGSTYTQAWSNTVVAPFVTFSGDRGLLEPTIAQFPADSSEPNRILIVFRTETGHPYFTYSDDGGVTLAPVAEWKFADGGSIAMASNSPYLFLDQDTQKVYFLGDLTFPGIIAGSQGGPRHPLVLAEVDPVTCGPIRHGLTPLLYRGYENGVLLPDAVQFSNVAFLKRYGQPDYEGNFARDGEDPANAGKGDNYRIRWELTAGRAPAGASVVTFAGAFHYFLMRRGSFYWHPLTRLWGPLGTGPARADFCTGLTQGGGVSTGTFLPPGSPGPVELVPYQMAGFQPADGDLAGDSTTVEIPGPPAPIAGPAAVVSGRRVP